VNAIAAPRRCMQQIVTRTYATEQGQCRLGPIARQPEEQQETGALPERFGIGRCDRSRKLVARRRRRDENRNSSSRNNASHPGAGAVSGRLRSAYDRVTNFPITRRLDPRGHRTDRRAGPAVTHRHVIHDARIRYNSLAHNSLQNCRF
jgi:hypothetical protein